MTNQGSKTRRAARASAESVGIEGSWAPDDRGILRFTAAHTEAMRWPIQCRCGKVYDIGRVEVTARYADCDMWNCPGCGAQSDNRPWVDQPYVKLGRA